MEQKVKKKKHLFRAVIIISAVLIFLFYYAYKFPVTMELIDKKINETFKVTENETYFTLFTDFSDFSKKAVNKTIYYIEIIKDNIDGIYKNTKKVSEYIFTSAAKFPLKDINITSLFGERINPITGNREIHKGIDSASPEGTLVFPLWPGEIYETGYDNIYGKFVIIKHSDDFYTKYCHLSDIMVLNNEFVTCESVLGKTGSTGFSTGSHLHFEVDIEGIKIDPMECFEF